ncbi:MAG: hypothetical protein AB8B49_09565 [Nitratireductor sp.]
MFAKFFIKLLTVALALLFYGGLSPSVIANHKNNDMARANNDLAVFLHLDGKIITLRNEGTGGYLRQGYGSRRDDKRNVEADRLKTTAPRGKGYDWVLRPAGDGYWYIVNLKTVLFLTIDGGGGTFRNVSNWGWYAGADDDFKWKIVPNSTRSRKPGFTEGFRIRNKATGAYLRTFGGNVTSMPQEGKAIGNKDYVWRARGSDLTRFEKDYRAQTSRTPLDLPSDDLSSLLKLTISSVKAIKTSTGQDGATKVLFTGIDFAVDLGMGVATGGASAGLSAGAKAAAKAGLKGASRNVTKKAAIASARAAQRKFAKKTFRKKVTSKLKSKAENKAEDAVFGAAGMLVNEVLGNPLEGVQQQATDAVGAAPVLNVAADVLDAMSSEAIFNKVYGESPDDLEIGVNGSSIFPNGGRSKGRKIRSQETLAVNKVAIFEAERGLDIHLIEYDYGSDDDSLGWFKWRMPAEHGWLENFIKTNGVLDFEGVLIADKSEGSLYELNFKIEPFRPYFLTKGILGREVLEDKYARLGCSSNSPKICARYIDKLMDFDNWTQRPAIRDQVLAVFGKHCEHPNGAIKRECRSIKDPLRATCNAGNQNSCQRIAKLNGAASIFINLRIWEGNCERSEVDCIKLGTAFLGGAPYEGPVGNQRRFQFAAAKLYDFCQSGSEPSCRMTHAVSEKLCAYFDDVGCFYRGRLDEIGKAGPVDVAAAEKWYKTGCTFSGGDSCAAIAQLNQESANITSNNFGNAVPSLQKGLEFASRGCGFNSQFSCSIESDIQAQIRGEKQKDFHRCHYLQEHSFCETAGDNFLSIGRPKKAGFAFQAGCYRANKEAHDGASCYKYATTFLNNVNDFKDTIYLDPADDPNVALLKYTLGIYKTGCEFEHADSCIETSKILTNDTLPERDPDLAYKLTGDLCTKMQATAGADWSSLCRERDRAYDLTPIAIHGAACQAKNANACIDLGKLQMKPFENTTLHSHLSIEGQSAVSKATFNFYDACELKNVVGCKLLGDLNFKQINIDAQSPLQLLLHGEATLIQNQQGIMQTEGQYIVGAKEAYKKACDLQDANACTTLKSMISNPLLNPAIKDVDIAGAQSAYQLGCSRQNQQACASLDRLNAKLQNGAGGSGNVASLAPETKPTTNNNNNNGPTQITLPFGEGCHLRGQMKSNTVGQQQAKTLFRNISDQKLFIYWLDEKGKETNYQRSNQPLAALEPGTSQEITTATENAYSIFSFENSQWECVGITKISALQSTIQFGKAAVTSNIAPSTQPQTQTNPSPSTSSTTNDPDPRGQKDYSAVDQVEINACGNRWPNSPADDKNYYDCLDTALNNTTHNNIGSSIDLNPGGAYSILSQTQLDLCQGDIACLDAEVLRLNESNNSGLNNNLSNGSNGQEPGWDRADVFYQPAFDHCVGVLGLAEGSVEYENCYYEYPNYQVDNSQSQQSNNSSGQEPGWDRADVFYKPAYDHCFGALGLEEGSEEYATCYFAFPNY